jgi:type VI secretion system protein ImpH
LTFASDLEKEPWRFDFYATLRRIERTFSDRPRIGDSAARREDYVALGEDPYLDFPASTLNKVDRDAQGRIRVLVKFLGLLGPQGALPLATTEESFAWLLARDDAFPRFLDLLNHRFLQLFFRAWADARPIAQHERPDADRFETYLGSTIGIGSALYRNLDFVADLEKLEFAGLLGAKAKSASRLKSFLSGLFGVNCEIDQFVGSRLVFEKSERSFLGRSFSGLGVDMLLGGTVFSLEDKVRVRIFAKDLPQYCRFLPSGDFSQPLADAVFFYIGEELDWDVELAIPVAAVEALRLGRFGQLGWTSWVAPRRIADDPGLRRDARFHPGQRGQRKGRAKHSEAKGGPPWPTSVSRSSRAS